MFSNFACLKDLNFDNFNEQNNELQYGKSSVPTQYDEKHIVDPTAEGDLFGYQDFVTSKNAPVDVRDYEISFESTFLQEHKIAFKIQTKNFIESAFQQFDDQEITFGSKQFMGKHLQFSSLAAEKSKLTILNKMKEFLKSISKHQKLNSLFDFIYETYPKEIANEFMDLACEAYNQHILTKNDEEDETNLLQKARQFSQQEYEKLFHGERINFLNLRNNPNFNQKNKQTVKMAFKKLIQFFFATVMLITDEYFVNPFGQTENLKRKRSFNLDDNSEEKEWQNGQNNIFRLGVKKCH